MNQKIIRKITLLLLLVLFQNNYANTDNPTAIKSINAYLYDTQIHNIPKGIIPLYGVSDNLTVKVFMGETYYGQLIKATEYPSEVYKAKYDKGYLRTIEKEGDNAIIVFNYDREQVLSSYVVYDKQTGHMITGHSFKNIKYLFTERYLYKIVYVTDCGFHIDETPFLRIEHKESFYLNYFIVTTENPNIYSVSKGYVSKKGSWFLDHGYGIGWKKNSPEKLARGVILRSTDLPVRESYIYNTMGLPVKNGMSPEKCRSYGIRDNKLYYYYWNN